MRWQCFGGVVSSICAPQPAPAKKASRRAAPLPSERIICIGDVHGHVEPLKRLWVKLSTQLGDQALAAATVVFLGDLCDRGPNTNEVLSFVSGLVANRVPGKTVVLAGNYDLAMAAFLGCLPANVLPDDLDTTKRPETSSGFWPHTVVGGMHYQGRRWGGSDIYEADKTFESYGVPWRSDNVEDEEKRDALCESVPEEHKKLLQSMSLVYDCEVPWGPGRLVCVHAGLITSRPAEPQIEALKARDLTAPALFPKERERSRLLALSGRKEVRKMHPDLEGTAMLVSGHHGCFDDSGDRIICDRSAGRVSAGSPLQAMILPERRAIGSSYS